MKTIYTAAEAAAYFSRETSDPDLSLRDVFESIKNGDLPDGFLSVVIQPGTLLIDRTDSNVDKWTNFTTRTPMELFVGGVYLDDFVQQLSLTGCGLPCQLRNGESPPYQRIYNTSTPIPAADVRLPRQLVFDLLPAFYKLINDLKSGCMKLSPLMGDLPDSVAIPASNTAQNSVTPVAGKKWTPEKLAELKAYRETHTMPETAVKFGITEQRIRQLQPSKKPKAKPFAGLIHRMK